MLKGLKLFQSANLNGKKLSESQKSAKLGKKLLKSKNSLKFDVKKNKPSVFTSNVKMAFNHLWLTFTKAPIFWHFDLECHIPIETDILGYAIGSLLNYLTFKTRPDRIVNKTNLSQWHPPAFFSRNLIFAKIQYKTFDNKFPAIVKVFNIWHHFCKDCKYKILILTDYNSLYCFMNTKNLSSRQICWAQPLSQYTSQINYYQNKANATGDALSKFL